MEVALLTGVGAKVDVGVLVAVGNSAGVSVGVRMGAALTGETWGVGGTMAVGLTGSDSTPLLDVARSTGKLALNLAQAPARIT